MSIRRSLALNVAPLALRLVLGATFIWAGVSKIAYPTTIENPRHLALLVEWDQIEPIAAPIPDIDPIPDPDLDPGPAVDPELGDPDLDTLPVVPSDDAPADEAGTPEKDNAPALDAPPADPVPAQDDQEPEADPATDDTAPPADDAGDDPEEGSAEAAQPQADPGLVPVSYVQQANTAEVKRVLGLALMIHDAANPGVDTEGKAKMPLWPKGLATGSLPVVIAWVAAILELVCGAALLSGFFTRMASLPLIGTMLTAMWLTQIGPAIQSGDALLGFLPQGVFDYGAGGPVYATLLWQFALAAIGFAMLLIGPGCFSIDRLIFGASASAREEEARQVEFVPMGD